MPADIKSRISGRQGGFAGLLLDWSRKNQTRYPWRKSHNPYHIMVSEILLRRTRAANVVKVYQHFINKFHTIDSLASAKISDIENTIRPLGLMSRSVKLKSVARTLLKDYGGILPEREKELLALLGPASKYTTNAIRCFALGKRAAIFDVNVKRIFERVFSIDFGKDAHKRNQSWEIVEAALPDRDVKNYNWALLDLGKTICTPTHPRCGTCPLNSICDYGLQRNSIGGK